MLNKKECPYIDFCWICAVVSTEIFIYDDDPGTIVLLTGNYVLDI